MANRKTGIRYMLTLLGIFLISEIVFPYLIQEHLAETSIKTIIICIPITFIFFGHKWAKWIASILLILNGTLTLFLGFEFSSGTLYAFGIFNLFFALIPHFSKDIQELFNKETTKSAGNDFERTRNSEEPVNYPYLITRYKAALVDGIILILTFACLMILVQDSEFGRPTAFVVYVIFVLLYEPLMIVLFSGTIGHKSLSIQVKSFNDQTQNVKFPQALLRNLIKITLGWLSFITIGFGDDHRAIHDLAGNSIVLYEEKTVYNRH